MSTPTDPTGPTGPTPEPQQPQQPQPAVEPVVEPTPTPPPAETLASTQPAPVPASTPAPTPVAQPASPIVAAVSATPPPAQPTIRRVRFSRNQWIIGGVIALVVACAACAGITGAGGLFSGGGSTAPATNTNTTTAATNTTAAPTATSKPLAWTTTHTFKGNGSKDTATFTAPDTWQLVWSCTPSSFMGGSYNVIISVNDSSGALLDMPVSTTCKAGNTTDTVTVRQGGSIYLSVISEGDWKILVQEQR